MRKILMTLAMIMASMIMMAQSQFYVIMKDGSGASYPENIVDSLTFDSLNGARIYGFNDLANSIAQLRKEVDSLKGILSILAVDTSSYIHEYVDLGLPSGTLWATCNVGAKKPADFGYYICWGETDKKSNYAQNSGKWHGKSAPSLRASGVIDQYLNLTPQYDAATVLWGEEWRTPTGEEVEELLRYCKNEWIPEDGKYGVCGIKFTSNTNNNSIFMPCAGMMSNNALTQNGTRGYYMTATSEGTFATDLYLSQDRLNVGSRSVSQGITIRPVRKRADDRPFVDPNDTIINGHPYVDLGLPSKTLWSALNMGADSAQKVGDLYLWGLSFAGAPEDDGTVFKGVPLETLIAHGTTDSTGTLLSRNDAATYNWGAQWRMPTHEDCLELLSNCSKEKKTIKGIDGWLLTGPNGKTLFFPITNEEFEFSSCWTSSISPNPNDDDMACMLNIYDTSIIYPLDWADYTYQRNKFLPIRPVVNR